MPDAISSFALRLIKGLIRGSGTVLQDLCYDYDNVGNIQMITDFLDGSRTQNFTYDDLNRLVKLRKIGDVHDK